VGKREVHVGLPRSYLAGPVGHHTAVVIVLTGDALGILGRRQKQGVLDAFIDRHAFAHHARGAN